MNPLRIYGSNVKLVGDGCKDLHAIKQECPTHGVSYTTAWEPTPDELAKINSGEPILLTVFGTVPPVWVGVRNAT